MSTKIESLTEAQTARIAEYRDKGVEVGLSTERVDFQKAVAALEKVYANVNLKMSDNVKFASGPTEAYKMYKEVYPKGNWRDFVDNTIYGNHDSYFLYFYKYINDVLDIATTPLFLLTELSLVSGWCYLDEKLVVIMDRPCVIKQDDRNLSHCENGPAIAYLDGTEVYMWHGVRIKKNWIVDRTLTASQALTETNIELRRVACEIIGWNNILEELPTKVIDRDADPEIGTLLEVNIPDIGKEKFLQVLCGTGRTFAIPVPPDMKTALEAQAWTWDLPADMMSDLEVRT